MVNLETLLELCLKMIVEPSALTARPWAHPARSSCTQRQTSMLVEPVKLAVHHKPWAV